ncbi:MAG: FAD-dependent monooxygenase [Pseudomonadota bacterium]|nr:FAD-dependent monooxygenase [Pseudomonadota bacterium]
MKSAPDLVIVGAGLAGLGLAAALVKTPLTVRVLSREALPLPPADDEPLRLRVSTLSVGVIRALQRLGVWPLLNETRLGRLHRMRVWEDGSELCYDSATIGAAELGRVVENDALVTALAAHCAAAPNVQIDTGANLAEVQQQGGERTQRVGLHLDDGTHLVTRLLVGADGGESVVRRLAGINAWHEAYGQMAVVANIITERPNPHEALQRFLPDGPLALLPLPGGASALVWSTHPEHAAHLCDMDDSAFCAVLQEASERRLGAVCSVGPRRRFTLRRLAATRYVANRIALVGDAAHVVHPLAGLGANLALEDAFALAELLAAHSGDPGDSALLRRYERWRQSQNAPVTAVIHGLNRLFRDPGQVTGAVRRGGLALINRLPGAKAFFMAHACGVAGDLPRLMRQP